MSLAKSFGIAAGIVAVVGLVLSMVLGYSGSADLRSLGNALFFLVIVLTLFLGGASIVAVLAKR